MLNRNPIPLALTLALGLSATAMAQTFPSLENVPTAAEASALAERKASTAPANMTPDAEATPDAVAAPDANATTASTEAAADPYSSDVRAAIGAPVEGKGKVVFFRPSRFQGGAVGFKVREGDTELGKLRNGRYFVVEADPGTHQYTVHSEAKDLTTLEIEAGETYFLEGKINMGFMVGRPNLTPSDVAAFEANVAKLKPAKPLDGDDAG